MNKKQDTQNVIQLHQNISLQQTYVPTTGKVIDYELYEESVQDILARIYEEKENPYDVMSDVSTLRNLFLIDVPKDSRPSLFRQLNSLVGSLMVLYLQHPRVYSRVYDMMTAFKNQVEKNEQQDEGLAEIEWEELQKIVYLLTDWEDGIKKSVVRESGLGTRD